ncbi:hypothetical protein [Vannielia litorea]|uniref:Uncharacterized protein n=1 Tax=Vannielia litorea TaxID=1217970 RepID=A0A1N6DZE3_9RHOB|nr:hypothetical protein [Vannielia litorea]SIN76138.1 hypothetical protein SAMN05444002_0172 [Vannielia litorea]
MPRSTAFTLVGLTVAAFVSACSSDAVVNTVYPDRERFAFANSQGERSTYLCAPGADAQKRAGQAHRYTEAQLGKVADWAANHIVNGTASSMEISRRINSVAKATVDETEKRYKCLLIDAE